MNEDKDRVSRVLRVIALIIAVGIIQVIFLVGGFFTLPIFIETGDVSIFLIVLLPLVLEIIGTVMLKRQPLASGILFTFMGGISLIVFSFPASLLSVANLVCGGLVIAYWWRTRKVKEQLDTET